MIRTVMTSALASLCLAMPVWAQANDLADWAEVTAAAEGQTVYFNAWGGSEPINDFIAWAADRVEEDYGVTVEHVKLADTADAVSRVIAERAAGRDQGGAVDLIWINGANFASMQEQGLLLDPWVEALPNWALTDPEANPLLTHDFTVPTNGQEAPWSMAQLVFFHDTARVDAPPTSMMALLDWAEANPGRFAYPAPPDFSGTTFLKQALIELTPDTEILQGPVTDANYEAAVEPLWAFLDELTPHLWRGGAAYPQTAPRLIQLMADGEIDIAFSFNPNEASNAIADFQLPDTVRSFVLDGGTLGNASFVAIPYNSSASEGAMVFANFLMSPEAQAHMQNPAVWGNGTVLALDRLSEADRALFENLELGIATLPPEELGEPLPEPHPSWVTRLDTDWAARYGTLQ
ncbi:MAG: ABC transporter substrate-binding protein [Pseudomonadota bacterium]